MTRWRAGWRRSLRSPRGSRFDLVSLFGPSVVSGVLFREVLEAHVEHAHRAKDPRQLFFDEGGPDLVENFLLRVRRDEVAEAALVLDDFAVEQRLIALRHGVRVHADAHGEVADRWNALAARPFAVQDPLADLVGDLLVDALGLIKLHGSPAFPLRAATRRTKGTAAALRSRRAAMQPRRIRRVGESRLRSSRRGMSSRAATRAGLTAR